MEGEASWYVAYLYRCVCVHACICTGARCCSVHLIGCEQIKSLSTISDVVIVFCVFGECGYCCHRAVYLYRNVSAGFCLPWEIAVFIFAVMQFVSYKQSSFLKVKSLNVFIVKSCYIL